MDRIKQKQNTNVVGSAIRSDEWLTIMDMYERGFLLFSSHS